MSDAPRDPLTAARLLESLPCPVAYIDADLVCRQCNAAAAATVGRTPDQIIGRAVASVVGADSEVVALLRRVLESGEPYSGTLEFTPAGSARTSHYQVSYVPDADEDGRTVGVLANAVDAIEPNESEQRFRRLVESMTEGVASHELVYEGGEAVDYRILEVNSAFEAQTGLSSEAVQGSLASEVYGTGEAPYLAEYARVAESGHAVSFETFFAPLERQFRIGVIRPAPGRFATIFEDVTERRQALEALRASEDRFATVFEKSPFALALSKMPEATLVAVNSAFEALFGFDRDEVLGKTSPDLGIADAASQAQLREKLAQCGYCHDFVCMRRTKSGAEIWLSLSVDKLVLDGDDYLLTTVQDVSERRRAEEALRESEERYRLLHETMLQGVVYQDADGTIVSMNPAAERILGKGPEDFLGSSSVAVERDTLREDGTVFPGLEHPAMVALRTGRQVPDVLMQVYNPREACYRLIDVQAVPLFRPGEERPHQVYTVFDDVTEQKRAEESLRSQAEMLDLSHDAIIVWQLGGKIELWNRGAEELYGFSKTEALGRVSHDLLSTVHQRPWSQIEATLHERDHWEGEVRHHAKDGREIVVSTRHQLIRGDDGVERVLETNRDVTEHRLAETERELLLEAAGALNRPVALADVLDTLARITLEVGGHSRVVISLWQEERGCLTVARSRGVAPLADGMTVAIEDLSAPARRAIEEDEMLLIDYDAMEPTRRGMGDRFASHVALDVPLFFGGRFVGLLATDDPGERREFSDRQIRLIEGVAAHAAAAIENARTNEAETIAQMEQAAREERSRLARDLHDSVTQALFAATLKAEALTLADDSPQGPASSVAEEVRRLNRGALAEMRSLLLELRGEPLEDVPIGQLLRHLVEAAEGRSSVSVQLTVHGDEQPPPALHAPIYRITQEALNNVTRHARAPKAWVDLDVASDRVRLVVGDDGSGFEPSACDPTHLGLRSMRERAQQAGARFDLVTELGRGTVITVEWQRT